MFKVLAHSYIFQQIRHQLWYQPIKSLIVVTWPRENLRGVLLSSMTSPFVKANKTNYGRKNSFFVLLVNFLLENSFCFVSIGNFDGWVKLLTNFGIGEVADFLQQVRNSTKLWNHYVWNPFLWQWLIPFAVVYWSWIVPCISFRRFRDCRWLWTWYRLHQLAKVRLRLVPTTNVFEYNSYITVTFFHYVIYMNHVLTVNSGDEPVTNPAVNGIEFWSDEKRSNVTTLVCPISQPGSRMRSSGLGSRTSSLIGNFHSAPLKWFDPWMT